MRPEQEPQVCARLEEAVCEIAARSRTAVPTPWADTSLVSDPGRVPPRVIARLAGLCRRHGYVVSRADLTDMSRAAGGYILGGTSNGLMTRDGKTVRLQRGMSPASEARVLAHETGHVILGHTGLTPDQEIRALMKRIVAQAEDPAEEAAAELAAGAFCKVAGIGTGRFSPQFIWQKYRGQPVAEEAIHAGLLGARIIWAAAAPALERRAA